MRRLAASLALALLIATAAGAQTAPPALGPPPPYSDQLLRLSEILGALSYLRPLCKMPDAEDWRAQMAALLDSEQPDALQRARLVDRFNRGYESFKSVYLDCTPAATLAAERYLTEGIKISADITARYGK